MKIIFALVFSLVLWPSLASAYEVSTITVEPRGSGTSLRVGSTSEIARFRVTNQGRKNLSLESLRLKNYGSARLNESYESLEVYHYDQLVASSVQILSKSVQFRFTETLLPPGDSLVLSVKGQLVYGRQNKDLQLGLQRQEDLLAKEITTGFYARCEDCRNLKFETYTLRSGRVGISRTSYFRPARYYGSRTSRSTTYRSTSSRYQYTPIRSASIPRQVSPGANEVTFLSSSISSNSGIRVDGLFLPINSGSVAADKSQNGLANELDDFNETFRNFRLYVNGYEEGSTNNFEVRNGQIGLYFSNTIDLPAQNQIVVTGRIDNDAISGDRLRLSLNRNSLQDPRYLNSGNTINNAQINGGVTSLPIENRSSQRLNIYQID